MKTLREKLCLLFSMVDLTFGSGCWCWLCYCHASPSLLMLPLLLPPAILFSFTLCYIYELPARKEQLVNLLNPHTRSLNSKQFEEKKSSKNNQYGRCLGESFLVFILFSLSIILCKPKPPFFLSIVTHHCTHTRTTCHLPYPCHIPNIRIAMLLISRLHLMLTKSS